MIKRVARVVALTLALVPMASFALGLGPITMRSALNQPLLAEIDIHSAQPGDLDGLTVKLASQKDFQRVNVERTGFLNKIHFSVALHKDGSPYIKLTTDAPVTEPYLDFLIEASWARGRALKEYTVLVDPPVLTAETPAPVQQATTTPVFSQPAPAATPRRTQRQPQPAPPRAARPAAPRQPIPTPTRQVAKRAPAPGNSYRVKANDTLSGIAKRMVQDNTVSLNQMMLALLKANPRAFYDNNINRLKAGYVLRMNDLSKATEISRAQANREVHQQYMAWREGNTGGGRLVQQTNMAKAEEAASEAEASGEDNTGAQNTPDNARLKLVAPGKEGAGSGSTGKDSAKMKKLQQDLILATEALDANKAETDDLKTRLSDLQDQLGNMQRLINLKDQEMQQLQNTLKKQQSGAATAEAKKPGANKPGEKKKPAVPPAKQEESFFASLLSSNMLMIVVAIILVFAVVAWLVIRRRKMQEGFEESILNIGMADSVAAATSQMLGQQQFNSESNMVSDFAMSGMDSMSQESTDVDPISEADVYLAYGRHQQAEDILRQALEHSPDRIELRSKLLEVLHAAKNRAGFEEQAQLLHQQLGGDESNEIWLKVAALGSQIAPDNAMFGAGGGADDLTVQHDMAGDVGAVTAAEEDLLDFDFDEDDTLTVGSNAAAGGSDSDDLDFDVSALDFDLEGDDSSKTAVADLDAFDTEDEQAEDEHVLDFDLGDDELETTHASVMASAPDEEQLLSLDDDEQAHDDFATLDLDSADDDSNDFAGIDLSLEDDDSGLSLVDNTSDSDDALDLDLELDDDEPLSNVHPVADNVVTLDTGSDDDEGLDDDIFADVDEIGTKLDLAKAYVDMGDSDGARSILDEVMEEGDDTQKQQAQQLLRQMG